MNAQKSSKVKGNSMTNRINAKKCNLMKELKEEDINLVSGGDSVDISWFSPHADHTDPIKRKSKKKPEGMRP